MAEANKTQETPVVQIKRGRGGRRPGAGRKPDWKKKLEVNPPTAEEIIAIYNCQAKWGEILEGEDMGLVLEAMKYLYDRAYGKARQAVDVSGGIMHAHTTYRNPQLAALSPEELMALDALTRKLALPAPNGPENQTESSPSEHPNAESPLEAQIVEEGTAG